MWYRYPDQLSNDHTHSWGRQPALVGRVLDDGSSQITQMTYNTKVDGHVEDRPAGASDELHLRHAMASISCTVEQVRSGGTDVIQSYAELQQRSICPARSPMRLARTRR